MHCTDRCFRHIIIDVSVEGWREGRRVHRGHRWVNFCTCGVGVRLWFCPVTAPSIVAPPTKVYRHENAGKLYTSCWCSCMYQCKYACFTVNPKRPSFSAFHTETREAPVLISLVPMTFEEEKGPGTHCFHMPRYPKNLRGLDSARLELSTVYLHT